MSVIRSYQRTPVWVVENHNEALVPIYRAIGSRHLPFEGIAMLHFDSHPDLQINPDMDADLAFDKQELFSLLSIENWITPAIYSGHLQRVTWIKPAWATQLPEGSRKVKIGKHKSTGKMRINWPDSYFLSDALYAAAENMEHVKSAEIDVVTMETPCLKTVDFIQLMPGHVHAAPVSSDRTAEQLCHESRFCVRKHSHEGCRVHLKQSDIQLEADVMTGKMCDVVQEMKHPQLSGNCDASEREHSELPRTAVEPSRRNQPHLHNGNVSMSDGRSVFTSEGDNHSEGCVNSIAGIERSTTGGQGCVTSGSEREWISQCIEGRPGDHLDSRPSKCSESPRTPVKRLTAPCTPLDDVVTNFSESKGRFILDIDLDFFSTKNPFREIYTKEQYQLLEELYRFDAPRDESLAALEECQAKRALQISELASWLKTVFAGEELEAGKELIPLKRERYGKVVKLVESLQSTPDVDAECLDPEMVHMAGLTCDDSGELPHHVSTEEEVESLVSAFGELLGRLPPPTLVTIARSSYDDYCPPDQVDGIQQKVLKKLQSLYGEIDVQLQYEES